MKSWFRDTRNDSVKAPVQKPCRFFNGNICLALTKDQCETDIILNNSQLRRNGNAK